MFTRTEKKFVDVFITLIQNGSEVKYDDSMNEAIKVNPAFDHYEAFKLFVSTKKTEMHQEAFEQWYENLTFDEINPSEKDFFNLPETKIVITIGAFEKLVNDMVTRTKELAEKVRPYCKPVNSKSNVKAYFEFNDSTGLYVTIYSEDDSDLTKYKNDIQKLWVDYQRDIKASIKNYNSTVENDTYAYQALGAWSDSVGRLNNTNNNSRGHLINNSTFEKNFAFDEMELKHRNDKGRSMIDDETEYFFSCFPNEIISFNID